MLLDELDKDTISATTTGGVNEVWLLLTNSAEKTCIPGPTLGQVWGRVILSIVKALPDTVAVGAPVTLGG